MRQNQEQNFKQAGRISQFLTFILPIVAEIVKTALQSSNLNVNQEGFGLDMAFSIKAGEKEIKFYLHNLLLEIATVDRDEVPLRFDENLRDFDFFLAKTIHLTESKLKVLFHLLREDDVQVALKNITLDAKQYERIRIWQFDKGTSNSGKGKP